ncbi:hypothetical protein BDZ94DRAFT_1327277 [Collybia nuda]|uniref:Uncharacterized protein n=1 Tax=Collybia nuda TaxID=64659 RepID=A0A9P5XQS5_9AGAR|nr:hypothetical protein BDZ94DRAFT_1327277 [Collybia nuda]
MARKKNSQKAAAARARAARAPASPNQPCDTDIDTEVLGMTLTSHSENVVQGLDNSDDECDWDGGINHTLSSDSEFCWTDSDESDDSKEFTELEGDALLDNINHLQAEVDLLSARTPYEQMTETVLTSKDWKKAESHRGLGYNGQSIRTHQQKAQEARKQAAEDASSKSASMMCNFFKPTPPKAPVSCTTEQGSSVPTTGRSEVSLGVEVFTRYDSDDSGTDGNLEAEVDNNPVPGEHCNARHQPATSLDDPVGGGPANFRTHNPPPLKRQKLDVPLLVQRQKAKDARRLELTKANKAITKLIKSKKSVFLAGKTGLQAYHAHAIKSYLHVVLDNGRKGIDTSERAAKAQGFSAKWGGRRVRSLLRFFILYHMTLLLLLSTDYLHMTSPSIYIHMFTCVVIILVIYPVA